MITVTDPVDGTIQERFVGQWIGHYNDPDIWEIIELTQTEMRLRSNHGEITWLVPYQATSRYREISAEYIAKILNNTQRKYMGQSLRSCVKGQG